MTLVKATNKKIRILDCDMPIPTIGPDDTLSSIFRDYAIGFLSDALDCSAYVSDTGDGASIVVGSEVYNDMGFSFNLDDILISAVEDLGAHRLREIVERAVLAEELANAS
jgi:hypothetical protein